MACTCQKLKILLLCEIKKETLQRVSLTTCKKAQLAILITTVVWDNVLKGWSVKQQAHYQANRNV